VQLPVGAGEPPRRPPFAVWGIAALDVALFVLLARLAPADLTAVVDRYGLVPRELLRALAEPASAPRSAWLAPLASMFLHADPLHLAGNLLYLWIFGAELERRLGHLRFLLFYLCCGLAAAALHVASAPAAWLPALGASGAISGLIGAHLASGPARRVRLYWPDVEVPALAFLLLWIGLQLAGALVGSPGVAVFAHLGGFAAGALAARALGRGGPAHARLRS
jgi:membrane associated rhomboid family serine protease